MLGRTSPEVNVSTVGPILGHVEAIRAAHRKLTGGTMTYPVAIGLLDRFNALQDDPTMPAKTWEVQVGCMLVAEHYSPESIRRVLTHVAIFRQAAGSPDLDGDDAEAVDVLLARR